MAGPVYRSDAKGCRLRGLYIHTELYTYRIVHTSTYLHQGGTTLRTKNGARGRINPSVGGVAGIQLRYHLRAERYALLNADYRIACRIHRRPESSAHTGQNRSAIGG